MIRKNELKLKKELDDLLFLASKSEGMLKKTYLFRAFALIDNLERQVKFISAISYKLKIKKMMEV